MKLTISKYRISTYPGGYKLARRKSRQWETLGYYRTLDTALVATMDAMILRDTRDFVIDFNDASKCDLQKSELLLQIQSYRDAILGAAK